MSRSIRTYRRTIYSSSFSLRAALQLLVAVLPLEAVAGETPVAPFPHDILDRVLNKHVANTGAVDYRALSSQPGDLETYVDSLALVSPNPTTVDFPDQATDSPTGSMPTTLWS